MPSKCIAPVPIVASPNRFNLWYHLPSSWTLDIGYWTLDRCAKPKVKVFLVLIAFTVNSTATRKKYMHFQCTLSFMVMIEGAVFFLLATRYHKPIKQAILRGKLRAL